MLVGQTQQGGQRLVVFQQGGAEQRRSWDLVPASGLLWQQRQRVLLIAERREVARNPKARANTPRRSPCVCSCCADGAPGTWHSSPRSAMRMASSSGVGIAEGGARRFGVVLLRLCEITAFAKVLGQHARILFADRD